jgi:hypothetical protein
LSHGSVLVAAEAAGGAGSRGFGSLGSGRESGREYSFLFLEKYGMAAGKSFSSARPLKVELLDKDDRGEVPNGKCY